MRITTEATIGHILFNSSEEAKAFVIEMSDLADAGETFEIQPYQGNRFHVARLYNGSFETYC
jgi:hypothetical protein